MEKEEFVEADGRVGCRAGVLDQMFAVGMVEEVV